ncbi:[F-actin]-monooxygenase mical3 [Saguinus oedipus]|uniref:[F-actin]-monooxygenase mical3 n=1 Tax=Saguinus oedipus TaxID=9490 RepID=A0ABQ9WJ97_SAGOE|nr:[F-actin]-monooxygenase mical3 [Saguinus oedipus]
MAGNDQVTLNEQKDSGNQRLQQVMRAADPLEIQADVHWTHIREREEEERMAPASESSASRGNHTQPPAAVP